MAIPIITPENQVIQDIEEWQKYVKVPDLRANCSTGWETALANKKRIQDEGYLATTIMGAGVFEELHMLMTFEDTLCNFQMYPDEMHELIVKDMEEIGIDIWQGVVPSNDICKIAGKLKGDMVLFGGIDSILDREDTQMEEVQAEVNRCCDTYGHIRNFIPGWTCGNPDTLYPHVEGLVSQAITNWNKEHFKMD